MVINGTALLADPPIEEMFTTKRTDCGVSYGLSEVGYDIRLTQDVMFWLDKYRHPQVASKRPEDAMWNQKDGRFILASAMEKFHMPNDLMAIVHDKSTWARQGLSVFNTVIEPGWRGFLTLELVFHGNEPITIDAGTGIAQVVFHKIATPAQYEGKYQDQKDMPVPSIFT